MHPTRRARGVPAGDGPPAGTVVERGIEHGDLERIDAGAEDSGEIETLPDGSVSIPLFEERLVVEKRLVVRERVVVRKRTVVEEAAVEADVRRERLDVEADPTVAGRVEEDRPRR